MALSAIGEIGAPIELARELVARIENRAVDPECSNRLVGPLPSQVARRRFLRRHETNRS